MFLRKVCAFPLACLLLIPHVFGVEVSLNRIALLPPSEIANVLEVQVSGGFLIGSDTEYPELSGWADVDLGLNMATGDPILETFTFRDGEFAMSDVAFTLAFGALSATTNGLKGVPATISPPGLVTDGQIDATFHSFTINRGQLDAAGQGTDFSAQPLQVTGSGFGLASLTEVLPPTANTRHFNVRLEIPVAAQETYIIDDVPLLGTAAIDLEVTGRIVAEKEFDLEVVNGDFNFDGKADCDDLGLIYGRVGLSSHPTYDLNRDGAVTSADATAWVSARGFVSGDANLDGVVDEVDLRGIQSNLFTTSPDWCRGDFNADGVVDGVDFNVWNAKQRDTPPAVVPEPSNVWMIGNAWILLLSAVEIRIRRRIG